MLTPQRSSRGAGDDNAVEPVVARFMSWVESKVASLGIPDLTTLVLGQVDDRVRALMGSQVLDVLLESLLRKALIIDSEREGKETFTGVLHQLNAKIRIARAVGLISKVEKDDLVLVMKIRNKFAHDLKSRSFEDGEIPNLVRKLQEGGDLGMPGSIAQLFESRVLLLSMRLLTRVNGQDKLCTREMPALELP